jgi:hypothetical protein
VPSLTKADRETILGPQNWQCGFCNQTKIRQYCRTHDVVYFECACTLAGTDSADNDHRSCRTYRWVDGKIVADPDFEALLGS